MMAKFEITDLLFVASDRIRKPTSFETEEVIALVVEETTMGSTYFRCCCTSNGRTIEYGVQNFS